MSITNYINLPVFIISLAMGLFFIYIFTPDRRTIYVYPTPENVGTIQYKDAAGNCFEFDQKKVGCPKESSKISQIPVQP